jgi:hypothetical protein
VTRAIKACQVGLDPHWKVRLVIRGALIHAASRTEPQIESVTVLGTVERVVHGDWIEHPDYGDTIGYVDWRELSAVSWRYSA